MVRLTDGIKEPGICVGAEESGIDCIRRCCRGSKLLFGKDWVDIGILSILWLWRLCVNKKAGMFLTKASSSRWPLCFGEKLLFGLPLLASYTSLYKLLQHEFSFDGSSL